VEQAIGHNPGRPVPETVETVRKNLLANTMLVPVHSFGAGKKTGTQLDQVRRIVKRSSVTSRQGAVLYRLTASLKPELILELGTSVGLGTLYLSLGHPGAKIITVEGNKMLSEIAGSIFLNHEAAHVSVMQCTFDEALLQLSMLKLTNALVFVDGDHTYDATLKYFRHLISRAGARCVMVFHDIHWSEGMHRAWKQMRIDPNIKTSYDLYDMGILCNFGAGDKKDFLLGC
jgi:predicted O-methyltransferase YrrM